MDTIERPMMTKMKQTTIWGIWDICRIKGEGKVNERKEKY
jgi:hypothetical protein